MALTERPSEGVFTGAVEVVIGVMPASPVSVSTLLSLRGKSDLAPDGSGANDRQLVVRHKKGSTYTDVWIGPVLPGESFGIGLPAAGLDASDESIVATLNGSGTFGWQAIWLDRV